VTEKLALALTNDEEILIRAFRACSHENQEHLFWLSLALSQRKLSPKKPADVFLLADPLRKFRKT
jgi:hypothetical protein